MIRNHLIGRNLGKICAAAILLPIVSAGYAADAVDCREIFAEKFQATAHTRVLAGATAVGLAANRPMTLFTHPEYDFLGKARIGWRDTQDFSLDYSPSGNSLRGRYKEIQFYGNFGVHDSWVTESDLFIRLQTGQIYSSSRTWRDGWKEWTNVTCYQNNEPGIAAVVITAHVPRPQGDNLVTLRMEVFAKP